MEIGCIYFQDAGLSRRLLPRPLSEASLIFPRKRNNLLTTYRWPIQAKGRLEWATSPQNYSANSVSYFASSAKLSLGSRVTYSTNGRQLSASARKASWPWWE